MAGFITNNVVSFKTQNNLFKTKIKDFFWLYKQNFNHPFSPKIAKIGMLTF